MWASHGSGEARIDVVALTVVTQNFPARPSSLPAVRDFVRRRLADTPMSGDDVRTLCERVADVLLDAAGATTSIQVSLRIFPAYAEVDVLFSRAGDEPPVAVRAGPVPEPRRTLLVSASPVPTPTPPVVTDAAPPDTSVPRETPVPHEAGADGTRDITALTFAAWLSAALRRESLTMEAAARRLNVSAKTVSRWVGGTTEPRLRDLARIRDAFGDPPFP
ncbi:MAG: hypothetical protein QOI74_1589 [Micromonosporaceae bacterium]|jgi:hypothetical protein|nr:hypothetical protein [Micromonosporaceae bacterium]MDT5035351.1 hypothetical protein [Micromonosporaceae bacterium]